MTENKSWQERLSNLTGLDCIAAGWETAFENWLESQGYPYMLPISGGSIARAQGNPDITSLAREALKIYGEIWEAA